MPPKEAAKKVAKKAAKKTPKPQGHDVRRAYEHLHRVNILHGGLAQEPLAHIDTLSRIANTSLAAGEDKTAADLLRAAEHIAFGSLASRDGDGSAAEPLLSAARAEYAQLTERAAAHWGEGDRSGARGIGGIYKSMLAEAKTAMAAGALHRALEYARGAEALAHAHTGPLRLGAGPSRKLKS
ncbi:MAG TPA: hypothetical protein VKV02_12570 [Acidobacteriaceae bacterium]|nr:hypothetical protein [Acidobacteriaceae bacterium]